MKKVLVAAFILMLIFCLNSCESQKQNTQQTSKQDSIVKGDTVGPKQVEITLYFPNKEFVETGKEELGMVMPEKRMVNMDGKRLVQLAMEELLKGPTDPRLLPLSSKVKLRGTREENGIAYVDFQQEGLSGGSLEESLVIKSVVMTLTGIEGINKVQFLVGGKVVETLMGHADITGPISR